MQFVDPMLLQMLSDKFQIGFKSPNHKVMVYDRKNNNKPVTLDGVLRIEMHRRVDAPASEFQIEIEDKDGYKSPDYAKWKFEGANLFRGSPNMNTWANQLFPNTKLEIWMGYGEELMLMLTGLIDRIDINPETKNLVIIGRSMYKKMLVETLDPSWGTTEIDYSGWRADKIITDIHNRLGLPIDAEPAVLPTGGDYIVPEFKLKRATLLDDAIHKLVLTTFYYIESDRDGKTLLKKKPIKKQTDKEDIQFDEAINLTNLQYGIEDYDMFNSFIIKSGNDTDIFNDPNFKNYVFAGRQFREDLVEVPWANTPEKRQIAAEALFRQQREFLRSMTVAVVGNPSLDLYDLVRVRETISTATAKYVIKSIRSVISPEGYFDFIDLTFTSG